MAPIHWLLDNSMGPPGPAGHWPAWLSVVFHAANFVSFAGFSATTLVIVRYILGGAGLSRRRMLFQTAFLPAVALKCLARVLEVGGPRYHLTTLLDVDTAVWVVVAACLLPGTIRRVKARRVSYHDLANRLQGEAVERELDRLAAVEHNAELTRHVGHLERLLEQEGWTAEKAEELAAIRDLLKKPPGSRDGN